MKVVWGFYKDVFKSNRNVITIGSFDGVHRGHTIILKTVKSLSRQHSLNSIVITFNPLPKDFFGNSVKLITTLDEKIWLLNEYGIDGVCVMPFDLKFSRMEPEIFLKNIWNYFNPYAVVVGYDHHFGKDRRGDISLLEDFSKEKGFILKEIEEVKAEGETVSSSKIRELIYCGEMKRANQLLGREFFFSASVDKGDGIGKTLSYPTANLNANSEKKILPKKGVYAARVVLGDREYGGLLYVGNRPTLYENSPSTCEVYMVNFEGNLYQKKLKVKVLERIREEKKFDSTQKLREQITSDEEVAKKILNSMTAKQGG
jgi:riboflavin kinase/FMN adenylyltransferase